MHQIHELEGRMGYEPDNNEPSSTPKLLLFSFPKQAPEPPGMLTPPLHTLASIPFQWEEAPGKPRACTTTGGDNILSKPKTARCLDLPPRLLAEVKVTNMRSPTTVLDGPYVSRSLSYTFSFRRGDCKGPGKGNFIGSSCRWGGLKENREVVVGSFDFSSSGTYGGVDEIIDSGSSGAAAGGGGGGGGENGTKVKITRTGRRGSFLTGSHTRSHLWASIYESFKQVVPWRRRQEKMRKMGS